MFFERSGISPAAVFRRSAKNRQTRSLVVAALLLLVGGCEVAGLSTAVGPSRRAILRSQQDQQIPGSRLIPVTNEVAALLSAVDPNPTFADAIGNAQPVGTIVGVGDSLEITILEAPPAVLFSGGLYSTGTDALSAGNRPITLPESVVGPSGTVTVPFAGQIPSAGRTLRQIEQTIVGRLRGLANQPQVIVRVSRNATANVSIIGEVVTAGRVPLTPRGERLLDIIARAGGTKQPVDRMTIQITRGTTTVTMPLQAIVRDARQNIVLEKDDIITALFQPNSLTVLGAAGRNDEVRFEGVGLTLSQALGRIGGLQDQRADPKGVFVFRWEPTNRVRGLVPAQIDLPTGSVPVIYQVDLKRPETLFASQNFAMKNGDVIFISNSPAADFQRFVNLLSSSVLPALSVTNSIPRSTKP